MAGADFRQVATGSIVLITASGSRTSDGEPRQIPAIVIDQYQEDGVLVVFAFHFEGQYLARVPVQNVTVLFDAGGAAAALSVSAIDELRQIVADDIHTFQRQIQEFREEVMGMLTAPSTSDPVDLATVPADVEPTRNRRK